MIKKILILFTCFLIISGCGGRDYEKKRNRVAARKKGDIVFGVVWPWTSRWRNLGKGVDLAMDEINKAGGVLGRKVKVVKKDDEASINKGLQIANEFAKQINMVAVIGHINSYISIPASSDYSSAGLLMLSPGSTTSELTMQGLKNIFRIIPNNKKIGQYLANYAAKKGYKRVIIYYVRNAYGRDIANHFERAAEEKGIEIIDRRSFLEHVRDYFDTLEDWKILYRFDAIFLAGTLPESATIIRQAREIGIKQPIFAAQGIEDKQLIEIAGKSAEGVVFVSPFNDKDPRKEVRQFVKAYKKRYGNVPDAPAALGYDAVKLLAHAITKAKTTVPNNVAKAIYSLERWPGVTGVFIFDKQGDLVDYNLTKKVVKDGKFQVVE